VESAKVEDELAPAESVVMEVTRKRRVVAA
jgi:hypothetical protein